MLSIVTLPGVATALPPPDIPPKDPTIAGKCVEIDAWSIPPVWIYDCPDP